jgi:hypothetical protein
VVLQEKARKKVDKEAHHHAVVADAATKKAVKQQWDGEWKAAQEAPVMEKKAEMEQRRIEREKKRE